MIEEPAKSDKPWREIAEEVLTEGDAEKVVELSNQLIEALDKESKPQRVPEHTADKAHRNSA